MSSVFVAFAVDAKNSITLVTRMCDSHSELLRVYKELTEAHGEKCLIITFPSLTQLEKDMSNINNEILSEFVVQSRFRHIVGLSQSIS